MKTCIQCEEATTDNFCPKCGQNQNVERLTLASFFSDFFSRVYGLDGAFPHTVIGLTKRPHLVAKEYISGIRGKYVGPVGYYFLIFTIFLLLVQVSGFSLADYLPKTENFADSMVDDNDITKTKQTKEIALYVKEKVFNNIQYVHVFLVPILALWSKVWFRKSDYNFIENCVFSFFIHAQGTVINIIGFLIFISTGFKSNAFISLMTLTYYLWSISLFYSGKIQFFSLLKGLMAYAFTYLSFLLFVAIVVFISLIASGGVH